MPLQAPLRNETELHLPFTGEWLCFWGGDTGRLNYHRLHNAPDQRFAFDFVKVDGSGSFYREDFPANANSYSFGSPIVSPAPGLVIDAMDELPDGEPGMPNETVRAIGNYVLIRHKEGEYSVLAHLQQGSVRVALAQSVNTGDVIGACGNSGHSTDPYLHYHLQNSGRLQHYEDESELYPARGIKPYFTDVLRERRGILKPAKSCSPIKGDILQQAEI
ncbi:MAG TPA: M23 family metallopeptidase [Candidatus Saccharimonadales bacterium]|nr:M23 family metallopeptidase [Candidatus Saccharimonadales bacterium]